MASPRSWPILCDHESKVLLENEDSADAGQTKNCHQFIQQISPVI